MIQRPSFATANGKAKYSPHHTAVMALVTIRFSGFRKKTALLLS
ncbi:Uncharacterised protein [Vibrio cholerae]|nr:Uncharacterised protein [Vibrio cholerae]